MLTFDLSNRDAAVMEMICGGLVQVLLDYIQPGDTNRALFNNWRDILSQGRRAMLVSTAYGDETHVQHIEHAVLGSDGRLLGQLGFSADGVEKLSLLMTQPAKLHTLRMEDRLVVADPQRPLDETQVVFLADKLVVGDQVADPEQRFARKMEKYKENPAAAAAIASRRETALSIRDKVERVAGMAVDAIVKAAGAGGALR